MQSGPEGGGGERHDAHPQPSDETRTPPAHDPRRPRPSWLLAGSAGLLAAGLALGGVAVGHATTGGAGAGNPNGQGGTRARLTSAGSSGATPRATITVTGSGQVTGTPDTLTFQIGVHTSSPSATAALEENNAKMTSLEASLERSGVAQKDLQTSNLDLQPNWDSHGKMTGFSADNDLTVTMHDVARAGAAIDAAAHSVGNGITFSGVSFSISNQSSLLAAARAKAMANAETEAQQVAAGAGLRAGAIVRVTDQENASPPVFYGGLGAASRAASVPLQAGTQNVTVQVSVVYLLTS